MDAQLRMLVEKAAVSESVKRYFLALDHFDWDGVGEFIADEFLMIAEAPGVAPTAVSREEFLRTLRERNGGFSQTLHLNPDHVVTVDGDRAHVSAHMWAFHQAGDGPKDSFWGIGLYEIDLVRESGSWKLCAQQIVAMHAAGAGAPPAVYAKAGQRFAEGLVRDAAVRLD